MGIDIIEWDKIPDVISKDQFYRICHISKATARHLLISGKVPCVNTGKKTCCYKIKKTDVQKYLMKRDLFPEAYSVPAGWYCSKDKKAEEALPPESLKDMNKYYYENLADYPDVMTTVQLHEFTGYAKATIHKWCSKGQLKSFKKGSAYFIPKVFVVEFFCSIHFRAINQKSDLHIQLLMDFLNWQASKANEKEG